MIHLNLLFTAPKAQGRGYASALVRSVTSVADAQHRNTYLLSSNIANTGFYNSMGFQVVDFAVVGEDNPDWHEAPVVLNIMVREFGKVKEYNEKAMFIV